MIQYKIKYTGCQIYKNTQFEPKTKISPYTDPMEGSIYPFET